MASISRKRQAPRRKQPVAGDMDIEQPRRTAMEEVDLFNVSIPEERVKTKPRHQRGSEDLLNDNLEEGGKGKTKAPSSANSGDDASFEDPYDFNVGNYDQFKMMMRKHCSKTYTHDKRPPRSPVSEFDALLNKLDKEEQRDPRPSHSYAPEEIDPSDESDDAEDFLAVEKQVPPVETAKHLFSEEPRDTVSIFDISDQAEAAQAPEPIADENIPPSVNVRRGKRTGQKAEAKSVKRAKRKSTTAAASKKKKPTKELEDSVSIFEISDRPASTSTPESRANEDKESNENAPPATRVRRGRQKQALQKVVVTPKRPPTKAKDSKKKKRSSETDTESPASVFDISISDQLESESAEVMTNDVSENATPPPTKIRRGRQKQTQAEVGVLKTTRVKSNPKPSTEAMVKAKASKTKKNNSAKEDASVFDVSISEQPAAKTPEHERDSGEDVANENASPSQTTARRSTRTAQKTAVEGLKVSKSKPRLAVTLPKKKAAAGKRKN